MGLFPLQFLVLTILPQSSVFPFISYTHSAAQPEKPQDGGGLESTKDVRLSSELQRLVHNSRNGGGLPRRSRSLQQYVVLYLRWKAPDKCRLLLSIPRRINTSNRESLFQL